MKFSSGRAPHWAGFLVATKVYPAGAIVVRKDGAVVVSRLDDNTYDSTAWVELGTMGASPTTVSHRWNMSEAQYPIGDEGEMSEPADVCKDCWKDADFKNAFRPEVHLYVIRELGL